MGTLVQGMKWGYLTLITKSTSCIADIPPTLICFAGLSLQWIVWQFLVQICGFPFPKLILSDRIEPTTKIRCESLFYKHHSYMKGRKRKQRVTKMDSTLKVPCIIHGIIQYASEPDVTCRKWWHGWWEQSQFPYCSIITYTHSPHTTTLVYNYIDT